MSPVGPSPIFDVGMGRLVLVAANKSGFGQIETDKTYMVKISQVETMVKHK